MSGKSHEDVWAVLVEDGYSLVGFKSALMQGQATPGRLFGWYCCLVFSKSGELCGMGAGAEIGGAMEEAVMSAGVKAGLVEGEKE